MEFLNIAKHIGLTFAIGSSTYAMVFYYAALWDGKIDDSEKHFMHIVYFILRIGLVILISWEIFVMVYSYIGANEAYFKDAVNWFRIALLGVIVCNAFLMTKHRMPMWLGPAIAGGSWYYYYFVSVIRSDLSIGKMVIYYVCWVAFLALTLGYLRKKLLSKPHIASN